MYSEEERNLLEKLGAGALDGAVGDPVYLYGGLPVWLEIAGGTPRQLKGGAGEARVLREWTSDREKLAFLKRYGWLTEDADAAAYSARAE